VILAAYDTGAGTATVTCEKFVKQKQILILYTGTCTGQKVWQNMAKYGKLWHATDSLARICRATQVSRAQMHRN
jgi:hypothetical protein